MSKSKIIVLGAGLVGRPISIDLSKDSQFRVSVSDINEGNLKLIGNENQIQIIKEDLSDPEKVRSVVENYDIVINALPGFLGFSTLKAIIEAKKDVVDISFFEEDPFQLDELAKENNVVAIMDCGVAPGMSNILVGYADDQLDETESVRIYVGGLPKVREWPYEYKAGFSPIDVIEEYTRPARFVEKGKLVIRPALSDPELLNFPGIGTLEAFNSDGLRSLIDTIEAPNMIEKTLRYPGHIEKIAILRETGFFSKDEIEVDGKTIRPIDLTAKLLFPKWELKAGEEDITIMKVVVEGKKDGIQKKYSFDLYDSYDPETETHSMGRTTGYTATMAVRMIYRGLYQKKGLSVPEYLGRHPNCLKFILNGLEERGINYNSNIVEGG